MRKFLLFMTMTGVLAVLAGAVLWHSQAGQDWLLKRAVAVAMSRPAAMSEFDGLQVFMCGTSSPMPAPGRAQACVAVLAGSSLYLVDAGAGSARVATRSRLSAQGHSRGASN